MSEANLAPPALGARAALFLDFDGTLAPLQNDPDAVFMPDGTEDVLTRLADRLNGALAVISGRDIADLSSRVPGTLWRFGNHGLLAAGPSRPVGAHTVHAPEALIDEIDTLIGQHEGVRLERKGPVLAVHYRAAPEKGPELIEALEAVLAAYPDYSLQSGKMVLEAKPSGANKGKCLEEAMETDTFRGRIPVMIGDDRTDEDAFEAARRLGGWAIKVGEGESCADFRLGSFQEVIAYLENELG